MITLRKDINILPDHFRYRKSLPCIALLVMFSINCDNPFIDEPKVRTINRLQSQCEDIKYELEKYHSNNASEKDLERLLRDQHELIRKEADLESDRRLGRNKMLEDLENQYSADLEKQFSTYSAQRSRQSLFSDLDFSFTHNFLRIPMNVWYVFEFKPNSFVSSFPDASNATS